MLYVLIDNALCWLTLFTTRNKGYVTGLMQFGP